MIVTPFSSIASFQTFVLHATVPVPWCSTLISTTTSDITSPITRVSTNSTGLQGLAFGRDVLDRFIRMEARLAGRPVLEGPELGVREGAHLALPRVVRRLDDFVKGTLDPRDQSRRAGPTRSA
jgi:hypothetical protein